MKQEEINMLLEVKSQTGEKMNIAQPIRTDNDLENIKSYYKEVQLNPRNNLLIVMGLNTALRISDLLSLRWGNVYDFAEKRYKSHICVIEQKTGKKSEIYLNENLLESLRQYARYLRKQKKRIRPSHFLFRHTNKNIPITRIQAFRIIKVAARYCNISGVICCHSLRKTFGYHAWKQGVSPALLVNIYNHSSYQVTKRYLGIEQEDRDQIFREIKL